MTANCGKSEMKCDGGVTVEVRIDLRLLSLSAILAGGSATVESDEPPLVQQTRDWFLSVRGHKDVLWLQQQAQEFGLLGLAMQVVQLGAPPHFGPRPSEQVPPFVRRYFADVDPDALGQSLRTLWAQARLESLFHMQRHELEAAASDLRSALGDVDIAGFQEQFYGRFPYRPVAVPLANFMSQGLRGVGVANLEETYAVCLSPPGGSFRTDRAGLLVLVQHEASHPILDDIQQASPWIPEACAFVEEHHPPHGPFLRAYGDRDFRWAETMIRASSYFFLRFLGLDIEAERYVQGQLDNGVAAVKPFITALAPWWEQRTKGRAPGLDKVIHDLPEWLRENAETTSA